MWNALQEGDRSIPSLLPLTGPLLFSPHLHHHHGNIHPMNQLAPVDCNDLVSPLLSKSFLLAVARFS